MFSATGLNLPAEQLLGGRIEYAPYFGRLHLLERLALSDQSVGQIQAKIRTIHAHRLNTNKTDRSPALRFFLCSPVDWALVDTKCIRAMRSAAQSSPILYMNS
jgi:hypothetical protein